MTGANDKASAISATFSSNREIDKIVLVAYDGVQPFDLVAASSVFARANEFVPNRYRIIHASLEGGSVKTSTGIELSNLTALHSIRGKINTVLVPGGTEQALRALVRSGKLASWLARSRRRVERIGSVCTGAFLLAASGLLNGKRAVTHWASCELLAASFPEIEVQPDALYISEGGVFTSAGVSASLDLSLALIEEDLGHSVAAEIARSMVLFLRRPGGQSQFSQALKAQSNECPIFDKVIGWIQDNLQEDLSVPVLASRFVMSERTFSRKFTKSVGTSPAKYVRNARLETARNLLQSTDWPNDRIAQRSGLGSVDALERIVKKHLGTSPSRLRDTYRAQTE